METLQQKQPITNGRINPSLSIDEMLEFDLETKKTFIHYTQTAGQFLGHFQDVASEVFEKLPELYEYKEIQAMTYDKVDGALKLVRERFITHMEKMRSLTDILYFELGRQIYAVQGELKFSGELKMSLSHLCGYITQGGHWNDFEPAKIIPVLHYLDKTAPRKNYGVNNCNTGTKQHYWTIKGDYIFINVDYMGAEELVAWQTWFKNVAHPKQKDLQADSMRISIDDFEHDAHAVQIVMWWD